MKYRLLFLFLLLMAGVANAALTVDAKAIGLNHQSPYYYIRLSVRNNSGSKLKYDISMSELYSSSSNRIVIKNLEIELGREVVHNLAIPFMNSAMIEVADSAGDRASASTSYVERWFLNICDIENWASEKDVADFSDAIRKGSQPLVSQIEPKDLPENWLCYTPFRAVFAREDVFNRMGAAEKDALMQWVNYGGQIILYGSDKNDVERRLLGVVVRQTGHPITDRPIPQGWLGEARIPLSAMSINPHDSQNAYKTAAPDFYTGHQGSANDFPFRVRGRSGKVGAFLLATLFMIVAGPLNYLHFKKKNNIRMILVSLPIISLAFCMFMVLYFFGSQGFTKKGGTFSVMVLDEKLGESFTLSYNSLFSGLYPFGGFRFPKNCLFHQVQSGRRESNFSMDLTDSQHLLSGLCAPSVNFFYISAMPEKSREKIVYDPFAKTITNGFEIKIEGIVIQDGGKLFEAEQAAPGAKVALKEAAGTELGPVFVSRFLKNDEANFYNRHLAIFAPPAFKERQTQYILRFAAAPTSVQTGTKIRSNRNCHLLVGAK